jgi:hypothetical protein
MLEVHLKKNHGWAPCMFSGLPECIPAVFSPVVDVIHLIVRILHEANVKPLGIGDLVRMLEIADSEDESGVVRQDDVSVRWLSDAVESKVLLKKAPGSRHVSDGKVDVIQFHAVISLATFPFATLFVIMENAGTVRLFRMSYPLHIEIGTL